MPSAQRLMCVVLAVAPLGACAPDAAKAPPRPVAIAEASDAGLDASVPVTAAMPVTDMDAASPPKREPEPEPPPVPPFVPRDVGPVKAGAPETDGHWEAVTSEGDHDEHVLWKTVLHPDASHPAAALFVVAVDLARARLWSVAGASEPATEAPAAKGAARSSLVPTEHHAALLAAFNGGWKGEHGHFGLKADGITFVKPREGACTIAVYEDGAIRIAPWGELADGESKMRFFRQTPVCMVARGVRDRGLAIERTTSWGAAADGDPVIRRSAIGLDTKREVLFVAVSAAMTAPAIADGMSHAGAHDVAELDVNWSYPKFLVFRKNASGVLEADSLFPGFVFDKSEYVRKRSARDFFYLTRRAPR